MRPQGIRRAQTLAGVFAAGMQIVTRADGSGNYGGDEALTALLGSLSPQAKLSPPPEKPPVELLENAAPDFSARMGRQMHQIEQDTQVLLEKVLLSARFHEESEFQNVGGLREDFG
jgi:hypothetical protein